MATRSSKYNHAGLGGTFDRLHQGHKSLIDTALNQAQKITIGLTIDDFSKSKKLHQIIHPYEKRFKQLKDYLLSIGAENRAIVTPLSDVYGPTISNPTIDCLVVTDHTYKGAIQINNKRHQLNQSKLPIIRADLIKDEEGGYLSSTRIRQGYINRQGQSYKQSLNKKITFTNDQKKHFKNPQGILINDPKNISEIISNINPTSISLVGDITLSLFLKKNLPFNLGFYDGKTQRKPNDDVEKITQSKIQEEIVNSPGTISPQIAKTYHSLSEKTRQIIKVKGEEDLIAVALVLLQPLQSIVIYGQPDQGLVIMVVTEDKKEQIKLLLKSK